MKQRFWLYKRDGTFCFQDSATGEQRSLGTKDRGEANRLLEIKIQSAGNPSFRLLLLKACLAPEDGKLVTRTWQTVMDQTRTPKLKKGRFEQRAVGIGIDA